MENQLKTKEVGENNIHSWQLELKGKISKEEMQLLNSILHERRKKVWADEIGIDWMDGMPLTEKQISTFFPSKNLNSMLENLTEKKYLVKEYPKKIVKEKSIDGTISKKREPDTTKELGYNIVAGKLSFEFSKILDINDVAPTLVAMDVSKLGVVDNGGIRRLTIREGLRLFGYPESYSLDMFLKTKKGINEAFDLLGNTVVIPVMEEVISRVADVYIEDKKELDANH